MAVKVQCCGKINLYLKILGKRADGYHDIVSVMQSISLRDTILFEEVIEPGIEIRCSTPDVPLDRSNLVWKAAEKLAEYSGKSIGGLRITIEKGIPVMGGLAGGSSDCAGALLGLRKLWKLDIDGSKLINIGASLGSDVPFCLIGGTAVVKGRGETLDPLPFGIADLEGSKGAFVIVVPPVQIQTKKAYDDLDEMRNSRGSSLVDKMHQTENVFEIWQNAIRENNFPIYFHNDFEELIFDHYPEIARVHSNLRNIAGNALMSGSGACIFSFVHSVSRAYQIVNEYKPIIGESVAIAFPSDRGVFIEGDLAD